MERHYQTVESVIYLECYIDQKSVGGGGVGEIKLHDRAQTCHWRVKLKLFVFVIFSCFPFFFFFFITQNFTIPHFALAVKWTTRRSCCPCLVLVLLWSEFCLNRLNWTFPFWKFRSLTTISKLAKIYPLFWIQWFWNTLRSFLFQEVMTAFVNSSFRLTRYSMLECPLLNLKKDNISSPAE